MKVEERERKKEKTHKKIFRIVFFGLMTKINCKMKWEKTKRIFLAKLLCSKFVIQKSAFGKRNKQKWNKNPKLSTSILMFWNEQHTSANVHTDNSKAIWMRVWQKIKRKRICVLKKLNKRKNYIHRIEGTTLSPSPSPPPTTQNKTKRFTEST